MAKKREAEKGEEEQPEKQVENEEDMNFSDPEDFVDDISDSELLADIIRTQPKETDGAESVIVIDGVPKVGPDRIEKLKNTILKVYTKFGTIVTEDCPVGEDGKTKGFIFLEYSNAASALEAVKATNGYKLDKHHVFAVNLFTDFEKYENIPDDWVAPQPQEYKEQGNFWSYLMEPDACDQYSVIYEGGNKLQICLNTVPEPRKIEERARWTEMYVRWSPLGTYLATFHAKGIALWGAEKFKQYVKFTHSGVQFIDFSPQENYLVTFAPVHDPQADGSQSLIIWDLRTGLKKRAFQTEGAAQWPIFKWSHDDKYFARMSADLLSVYETPSFGLLDKKSIKVSGIRDFSWSPTENTIAYWVAEEKDVPSRVVLLEIPSRAEIRAKNLFNVADCKMHWQKSGDFLCVKVDRYSKVKKEKNDMKFSGIHYNFEIFHMREKQVPVDSVEIKEPVQAFAWEPVGSKFAVIHGESPAISVSFYGVKTGQAPTLLKKYDRKTCNHLFWAPQGQFIVLAGLRSMNGTLEFLDTSDFTIMATNEHFMATDVEWDPTGRYVTTGVSWWGHKVDNAYWLWTFQGRILKRFNMDRFCQLLWRPRPATLLAANDIKEIKRNMKKYSQQFEVKDIQRQYTATQEQIDHRRRLMEQYEEYRAGKMEQYNLQKKQRLALRNNVNTDDLNSDETNLDEEEVEFFIKEEVVVIDK